MIFVIIWEMFHGRISLNSVLLYILRCKYQVKPHSSPWFSTGCTDAIVCSNHFFHLYQQNKCPETKVKFRQTSNRCKNVLETAKLAYATQTKESITSQELGSQDFWWIATSVLNRDKSAIPSLFNSPEVLSSAIEDWVISFFPLLQITWNYMIFL